MQPRTLFFVSLLIIGLAHGVKVKDTLLFQITCIVRKPGGQLGECYRSGHVGKRSLAGRCLRLRDASVDAGGARPVAIEAHEIVVLVFMITYNNDVPRKSFVVVDCVIIDCADTQSHIRMIGHIIRVLVGLSVELDAVSRLRKIEIKSHGWLLGNCLHSGLVHIYMSLIII